MSNSKVRNTRIKTEYIVNEFNDRLWLVWVIKQYYQYFLRWVKERLAFSGSVVKNAFYSI